RDIGAAYVVSGLVYLWIAFDRAARRANRRLVSFTRWPICGTPQRAGSMRTTLHRRPDGLSAGDSGRFGSLARISQTKETRENSHVDGSYGGRSLLLSVPGTMMRVTSAK